MTYDFSKFKKEITDAEEWLKREYASFNTGRATSVVLDNVVIEVYGSRMPISHIATIATEDARTLKIVPWDKTQIKDIEKAMMIANLGLSVSVDDTGIRVSFPQLTTERRIGLIKILKDKLEEARVSVRGEREKVWNDIQEKERDGKIPEDEKFKGKEELQKIMDDAHKKLEAIFEKKEKEVMG
ncbi:MAG: ribosome recycling factor [Candidatus Lloydbacteria bacterium RIFCSPHIGHO2_01_FULL_41_20]|uniref:Ribosome recycling factor n=1 Tax=Candidatus Lloydbacteria bacterium RIFCSPHIGHO2_01_FULL_41_20 TaxID=1798657 RepID=A0A1G2CRA6_9BACT|nr:MAG: ribosome recycling factor [Candidatus Lloydbacteria bacterium RIFCSPHIGHO2_01_FULL_41_20]